MITYISFLNRLNAKVILFKLFLFLFISLNFSINSKCQPADYNQLSVDFLEALKANKPIDQFVKSLSETTVDQLDNDLNTQDKRLSFWINTYNAFIQVHLTAKPEYYEDRRNFFKLPLIDIAGQKLSFADIEHGIIRRSQLELFLGYIINPLAPKYEKQLRVFEKDFRIHFALNCGAKSCPPVGIFTAENFEEELNIISKKFLEKFSTYDPQENLVTTTSLFSWFRGDFGGSEGIREILFRYGIAPSKDVRVKISEYDWTLALDNYVDFNVPQ